MAAPRPEVMAINVDKLLEDTEPLLRDRTPGFAWDGSEYLRPNPNQAPHIEGLKQHEDVLTHFLKAAPSGFATLTSTREFMMRADQKWSILGAELDKSKPIRGRWERCRNLEEHGERHLSPCQEWPAIS